MQANKWQKHGLVCRNRKKNSQIIKDYFYLPFFLLIILCREESGGRIKINGMSDLWMEKKRGVAKREGEEERMRRMQRGSRLK
jgi:hypothetical protein